MRTSAASFAAAAAAMLGGMALLLAQPTSALPGAQSPSSELAVVNDLAKRDYDPSVAIWITSKDNFCVILPKEKHTDIGDSEHPGGMKARCLNPAFPEQGRVRADLFTRLTLDATPGTNGARRVQLTGCIDPTKSDFLNAADAGGQYDSHGGEGGLGNPRGSVCLGYAVWVGLWEPAGRRFCLRCCDNRDDCRVDQDTMGCQVVIPGDYEGCSG